MSGHPPKASPAGGIPIYDSARRPPPFIEEWLELFHFRALVTHWALRNITLRYKRSVLGVFWTVIEPLTLMIVLTIVFSNIFVGTIQRFPVYVLAGLTLFDFFSRASLHMVDEITVSQNLSQRIHAPMSTFAVAAIASYLINWAVALVPMALVMAFLGHPFTWALVTVPAAMLVMAMFTLGVGLVVSTLGAFFHDFKLVYQALLTALFYASPIIYPLDIVPDRFKGLILANPLTYLCRIFRDPFSSVGRRPAESGSTRAAWPWRRCSSAGGSSPVGETPLSIEPELRVAPLPAVEAAEPAVQLEGVGVRYRVPLEEIASFKEFVLRRMLHGIRYRELWALQEVDLEIRAGEIFGIVGRNGAGKSTMLKVIARVLRPTAGRVVVRGTVAPLLELGAGFHADLTGEENIFLNGSLLGYTRREIQDQFDEVIEFSELQDFIHLPIRKYSTGMVARLGFAVATMYRPDLLLVDEVLAVGDLRFQEKCLDRIHGFRERGTAILLVTHAVETIQEHCERAACLDAGRVAAIGPPAEVLDTYRACLTGPAST